MKDAISKNYRKPKGDKPSQSEILINEKITVLIKQLQLKDERIVKLENQIYELSKRLDDRLAESNDLNRNNQILIGKAQQQVLEVQAPKKKSKWLKNPITREN